MAEYDGHTPGPWKIVDDEVVGRSIHTDWDHPQLRGPAPVVSLMYSRHGARIYISDADTELIRAAPDLREENRRLREALDSREPGREARMLVEWLVSRCAAAAGYTEEHPARWESLDLEELARGVDAALERAREEGKP